MKKESIVLKDGTQFEIENGAAENSITVIVEGFAAVEEHWNQLTDSNLEEYSILNSAGLACATLTDKYVVSATVSLAEEGYRAMFALADVDMTEKRLNEAEDAIDALTINMLMGGEA